MDFKIQQEEFRDILIRLFENYESYFRKSSIELIGGSEIALEDIRKTNSNLVRKDCFMFIPRGVGNVGFSVIPFSAICRINVIKKVDKKRTR